MFVGFPVVSWDFLEWAQLPGLVSHYRFLDLVVDKGQMRIVRYTDSKVLVCVSTNKRDIGKEGERVVKLQILR